MKSYLLHTRPQSFPVTFFAAITGYALSPAKAHTATGIVTDLLLLLVIFSILLWGGTNAFNSGQDGDDGPLTLLPSPPKVPAYLSAFGIALMFAAIGLSFMVSTRLAMWTAVGVGLSIFYSWRNPFFKRGKDIAIVDMLINSVGFGFCSILFGYMMTPALVTSSVMLIGLAFTFAYQGGMPTSQIFQLDGRTVITQSYTTLLGVSGVLKAGAGFFILHILFLSILFTDIVFLKTHPIGMALWLTWLILVLLSAVHSWWWSRDPFTEPYKRMNRQMIMMMTSQVAWTALAWMYSSSLH